MDPIRIMLVDNNPAFAKIMQEVLRREPDLDVVAVAHNGSDALKTALSVRPEVLVTDLVMPVLDGFALMEELGKTRLGVRIIVLTELTRDSFIRQAMALGACYYMVKPVDPAVLISRVRDSRSFAEKPELLSPASETGDAVGPLLSGVGVTPGTAGYKYLHLAITLASKMGRLSGHITTELYPAIARTYQTDQRNVERAIRHAIKTAWASHAAPGVIRPTNGELIAQLARQFSAQRGARH